MLQGNRLSVAFRNDQKKGKNINIVKGKNVIKVETVYKVKNVDKMKNLER